MYSSSPLETNLSTFLPFHLARTTREQPEFRSGRTIFTLITIVTGGEPVPYHMLTIDYHPPLTATTEYQAKRGCDQHEEHSSIHHGSDGTGERWFCHLSLAARDDSLCAHSDPPCAHGGCLNTNISPPHLRRRRTNTFKPSLLSYGAVNE